MAGVRWLDEKEEEAWRGLQLMQLQLNATLNRELADDAGLSHQDYMVLVALTDRPDGRMRAFELGRLLGWEKSRLSHHISRMAERGFVTRKRCTIDQRGAFVVVTKRGRTAIETAAPGHVAGVRRHFIDLLTPEQLAALSAIAGTVLDKLTEECEDALATDYIGLGPVGEVHPYLSGPSEGNSVIDAVRAARNLADAHAGTRWLAIGHSQGGHAALFAGERADQYAPELDLLGTVAFAPAAELAETYGPVDEVVARVVGVMALFGAAAEHPDIDFDEYAGPEVEAASEVIETECLDEIINAFVGIPGETFYEADPLETEPARSIFLEENDPGRVAADSPLFLMSGTVDDRVVIDRVRDLFDRLCTTGQVTELLVVDGANHGDVIPKTSEQVEAWLSARLAGEPATDSCGPGTGR